MIITPADTAVIISATTAQALREIGIPSPGVTQGALMYAGWQLATGNYFTGLAIITGVSTGCVCGALTTYFLANSFGLIFVNRFSKFLRLTPEKLEQVKNMVGRKTLPAIVLGRLIFTLKASLSAAAGLMRIRVSKFMAGTMIALVFWESLYVSIGAIGKQVFKMIDLPWNHSLILSILGAIAVGVLVRFGVIFLFNRRRKQIDQIFSKFVSGERKGTSGVSFQPSDPGESNNR
jgi:membrane protein DedA with SNARE-associated domain